MHSRFAYDLSSDVCFFFFKQKTAYEMRISDWSSDVCSSDLFIGFSIGADFDSGFTRRLFLAAPHRSAVVFGYGVAAVIRAFMVWAMVFAIAILTEIGRASRRERVCQ